MPRDQQPAAAPARRAAAPVPGQRDYGFPWPPQVPAADFEALAEHAVLRIEALTGRLASAGLERRGGR